MLYYSHLVHWVAEIAAELASELLKGHPDMKDANNNGSNPTETKPEARVVSLTAFRKLRIHEDGEMAYQALIASMDKIELLDEMVRFQENRTRAGHLTIDMMVRGKILFRALEKSAETQELRILTRSYARHLEFELQEHFKNNR